MSWRVIIESDVQGALNNSELEKYRELVAAGEADPVAKVIGRITDMARGYVGKQTSLSAAGLPPEVIDAVVSIIVYRIADRANSDLGKARKPAADDAQKFLESVAKDELFVSPADSSTVSPTLPSMGSRDRFYKPEDQDGI